MTRKNAIFEVKKYIYMTLMCETCFHVAMSIILLCRFLFIRYTTKEIKKEKNNNKL